MVDGALQDDAMIDASDAFALGPHLLDTGDALDDELSLDAWDEDGVDAGDEGEETDEMGEDALGADDSFEDISLAGDGLDDFESDEWDAELEGDAFSPGSLGLVAPAPMDVVRVINPFVASSLGADGADEFFGRVWRRMKKFGGGLLKRVGGIARAAAGGLGRLAKLAGPMLLKALPMIQKVAGFAGPWGRLLSAGLGAAKGLMEGKGLRGALAGALSGAIPGIGGKIAGAVLKGDGADDDAALDALADMTDAGEVDAAVALPLGAGLAARTAARAGLRRLPRSTRQSETWLARLASRLGGSPGRRQRILRAVAREAIALLRQWGRLPGMTRSLLRAFRVATKRVLGRLRSHPTLGSATPGSARRRLRARWQVMSQTPLIQVYSRYPGLAFV